MIDLRQHIGWMNAPSTRSGSSLSPRPSESVTAPAQLMEIEVRSLSRVTHSIKLDVGGSLIDLRSAVEKAFGVPLQEQMIHFDAVNPGEAFRLCGPDSQALAVAGVVPGVSLFLVRQDPRTTSEKNCILLDALKERRLQDALEIMRSAGFPVDPNCVDRLRSEQDDGLSDTALSLAVRARKQWDAGGQIVGEGAPEEAVRPVIEKLLEMGADIDGASLEIESCGSWPAIQFMLSPLHLAIKTGSPSLVQLLLDAGANPDMGSSHFQFANQEWMPCDRAASSLNDDMKKNCLALLHTKRRQAASVPKCPDEIFARQPRKFPCKRTAGDCRCEKCKQDAAGRITAAPRPLDAAEQAARAEQIARYKQMMKTVLTMGH